MDSRSEDLKYEEKKSDNLMPEDNVSDVVPLETVVWTAPPAEDQPATVQCGQHHDTLGHQCPSQPPLDQLPYRDFLMYPQSQQFSLHNSSITDAGDSGQSGTTSWFTTEPILCSMMPGEVHPSEANICVALEKGSLDSSHLTYPMLYNGNQNGQILFMNSDSGPMFVTLENAPAHRNNSFCQEEVVTSLPLGCCADPDLGLLYAEQNASNDCRDFLIFSDYNQVACPSDSTETSASRCCQASVSQTVRTSRASRSYKPCHCTKSKCLKLYCECFAAGVMCNNCNCTNCHNNPEHEAKRGKAIKTLELRISTKQKSCLMRKPDAFRPKISGTESGEVKGWHSKGCNCKRSGCLKNYCECYEANIRCTPSCKCVGCRNYEADLADNENDKSRGSESVITPTVMEAVVGSLLACAAESERNKCSEAWGQHVVLSQFGLCLTQIVKAMFK